VGQLEATIRFNHVAMAACVSVFGLRIVAIRHRKKYPRINGRPGRGWNSFVAHLKGVQVRGLNPPGRPPVTSTHP